MQVLTSNEIEAVSGGRMLTEWALGEALSWALGAIFSGRVDYAGLAEQQGSSYNMLGA